LFESTDLLRRAGPDRMTQSQSDNLTARRNVLDGSGQLWSGERSTPTIWERMDAPTRRPSSDHGWCSTCGRLFYLRVRLPPDDELHCTGCGETEPACVCPPVRSRSIAAKYEGRDICGYLREVERFFGIMSKEPVLLSVSFASYLAGVFLASELLKHFAGIRSVVPGRYQIDPVVNLTPERPYAQNKGARLLLRRED